MECPGVNSSPPIDIPHADTVVIYWVTTSVRGQLIVHSQRDIDPLLDTDTMVQTPYGDVEFILDMSNIDIGVTDKCPKVSVKTCEMAVNSREYSQLLEALNKGYVYDPVDMCHYILNEDVIKVFPSIALPVFVVQVPNHILIVQANISKATSIFQAAWPSNASVARLFQASKNCIMKNMGTTLMCPEQDSLPYRTTVYVMQNIKNDFGNASQIE